MNNFNLLIIYIIKLTLHSSEHVTAQPTAVKKDVQGSIHNFNKTSGIKGCKLPSLKQCENVKFNWEKK